MFVDYDEYDGYCARPASTVCPQCGRPEMFCDPTEHATAEQLAASLARTG